MTLERSASKLTTQVCYQICGGKKAIAIMSLTIKYLIEDDYAESAIPLLNVISKIFAKVIEYRNRSGATANGDVAAKDELKTFDADFVKVDESMLFELVKVALTT